ncbi:hypothetical protein [Azospirillum argentinense]
MDEIPRQALKGRGAISNLTSRYERETRVLADDGWGGNEAVTETVPTQVFDDTARSVLSKNTSPDVIFERSVNPYRGCEHVTLIVY